MGRGDANAPLALLWLRCRGKSQAVVPNRALGRHGHPGLYRNGLVPKAWRGCGGRLMPI